MCLSRASSKQRLTQHAGGPGDKVGDLLRCSRQALPGSEKPDLSLLQPEPTRRTDFSRGLLREPGLALYPRIKAHQQLPAEGFGDPVSSSSAVHILRKSATKAHSEQSSAKSSQFSAPTVRANHLIMVSGLSLIKIGRHESFFSPHSPTLNYIRPDKMLFQTLSLVAEATPLC